MNPEIEISFQSRSSLSWYFTKSLGRCGDTANELALSQIPVTFATLRGGFAGLYLNKAFLLRILKVNSHPGIACSTYFILSCLRAPIWMQNYKELSRRFSCINSFYEVEQQCWSQLTVKKGKSFSFSTFDGSSAGVQPACRVLQVRGTRRQQGDMTCSRIIHWLEIKSDIVYPTRFINFSLVFTDHLAFSIHIILSPWNTQRQMIL